MVCTFRSLKLYLNLTNIVQDSKCGFNVVFLRTRRYSKSQYKALTRKFIIKAPFTMKIDSPQFKACITEEVVALDNLFKSNGYELRIVGGAVRDLLLGFTPKDLDFATTATPAEMKYMFTENNIRLINVNGEKHGTITSRINDKNFEVTTLRIDSATDGRHAVVEFTKDWAVDANRRDLTVNAMYLGLDGTLYDYFNGYEDLKNKQLRFVGDAASRIQEDYLRILRYFRFYGVIAEGPDNFDEYTLNVIQENKEGLLDISGERIWVEMNKILTGKFSGEILIKMLSLGLGPCIGLPSNPTVAEFKRVTNALKMKDVKAKPMTLLAALFESEDDLNTFCLRIKPSKLERELCSYILTRRAEKIEVNPLRTYKCLLLECGKPHQDFVYELLKYLGKFDVIEELKSWHMPVFPVNGHDLKAKGIFGKEIGQVLLHLKKIWFEHDFNISAEELLEYIPKKKIKVK